MTVYLVTAFVTIFLAFLSDREVKKASASFLDVPERNRGQIKNKLIYAAIGFLLFGVSAARIAVGGDYWRYTSIFSLLAQNRDGAVATEIGFNLLVKAVQHVFGFDGKQYLIIFAIVAFITVLFFMRGLEEHSDDFAISFSMFMLLGYYASSFNSIRNYLAFAVAFYSVKYIFKREFWKFAILILFAASFHMSALIVLLAYPLGLIRWKVWSIVPVALGSVSLLAFPNFYRRLIFLVYPHYENSIYDVVDISYINIARFAGVLILSIIFYKKVIKDSEKYRFAFNMNLFAGIIYICCSFMPVVSRIGYYFNIFQLILIPAFIDAIPKKWVRVVLKVLLVTLCSGYYLYFLHQSRTDATVLVPYFCWIIN